MRSRPSPTPAAASATRRSSAGGSTLTPDSLATIIYTSGTTGRPKGCELTHGNFLAEAHSVVDSATEMFNENGSTLLFLPLAHVFARMIEIGTIYSGVRLGHTADVKNLLGGPRRLPADLHPLGAAGVREGLQLLGRQGGGRGQGQDLPPGSRHGDRVLRGARQRRIRAGRQAPARRLRPARLRQAAHRARRSRAVRRVRWRPARGPAGPLLPRHRRDDPRGVRPDGDVGRRHPEPSGRAARSAASASRSRDVAEDRRRRRGAHQGADRLPRLLEQPDGHGRGAGERRLVPQRRRRRDRRRGLPHDHRPQEGDPGHGGRARTSHRRCSRTGSARTRWSASASWSATTSRSSPRWSPSTPRRCPGGSRRRAARAPTSPRLVDDDALRAEIQHAVDDANKAVSQRRGDQEVRHPADRLHRGGRTADTRRSSSSATS